MQRLIKTVVAGLFTIVVVSPLAAQPVPILRQNQIEVGAFGGFNYGADNSHGMGGGNITYSALRWLLPYAEVSYLPGVQRSVVNSANGVPTTKDVFNIPFTAVDFGVHVRFRVPHTRIVPYAVAGGGLMHWPGTTDRTYQNSASSGAPSWFQTGTLSESGGTSYATNLGGGVRYYVGEQFGFRAETKGYRVNNPASKPGVGPWIYQATFGIFFQFGL
ncbi:MAG TPA: hypothetical protein VMI94_25920 [Bryobacteraceae bacterium]|nr:hypothetical protein [Bryobacteraceae bacterium]